jgi:hypothetical protein
MRLSFPVHPAKVIFLLFSILSVCQPLTDASLSAESPVPPPDTETRSFILGIHAGTMDGKTDKKAASARLIERGKQTAREKIKNLLAEKKAVDLDFELPSTKAGFVKVLRQEETPSQPPGRKPSLWLETEGTFLLKNPKTGKRPEAKTLDRAGFLDVRIWTDQREYKNGQKIILYLQGNRDFQGKIIRIDPEGRVHQILPNNYRQLSSFIKGKRYALPDEGDRYELNAQPPFGLTRFIVYATPLPMSQVNLATTTGGIFRYRSSEKSFGRSVRHVIPSGEEQLAEFYEARWEIKTVPGK